MDDRSTDGAGTILIVGASRGRGHAMAADIPAGAAVRWSDVSFDAGREAVRLRREMEDMFRAEWGVGRVPLAPAAEAMAWSRPRRRPTSAMIRPSNRQ